MVWNWIIFLTCWEIEMKLPFTRKAMDKRARVVVMDNPCFAPGAWVITRLVKSYDKDTGEFETKYFIYRPEE